MRAVRHVSLPKVLLILALGVGFWIALAVVEQLLNYYFWGPSGP
jgi:hypothetical protein